jgi:signal transduction histidine kinase
VPVSPPRGRPVRNPLSLVAVESAIARSAAGFGIAFFLQSIPPMLDQLPNMRPGWANVTVTALVVSLVFAVVAAIVGRWVRIADISFAAVYLIALVSWPFAVVDVSAAPSDSYWLYYIMTIATAMATVGTDIRFATVYVIAIPVIYAVIRVTPAGGQVTLTQAVLDSVYAIILGGVITIITTILRNAATAVDRAQQTALERYSHAVRQHAIEAERVQVDAIVHDSVLTTFLSAARAFTPEAKELAATMAGNAIGHLRDAVATTPDSDASVRVAVLASRLTDAASTMSQPFSVDTEDAGPGSLPLPVAEAIYSAAVQGMVNSLQHAGADVDRWVVVRGDDGTVEVTVGDRGAGFEPSNVPTERLGVRVSILERVAGAGGRAEIDSTLGEGTVVTLRWPDPHHAAAPALDSGLSFGDGEAS